MAFNLGQPGDPPEFHFPLGHTPVAPALGPVRAVGVSLRPHTLPAEPRISELVTLDARLGNPDQSTRVPGTQRGHYAFLYFYQRLALDSLVLVVSDVPANTDLDDLQARLPAHLAALLAAQQNAVAGERTWWQGDLPLSPPVTAQGDGCGLLLALAFLLMLLLAASGGAGSQGAAALSAQPAAADALLPPSQAAAMPSAPSTAMPTSGGSAPPASGVAQVTQPQSFPLQPVRLQAAPVQAVPVQAVPVQAVPVQAVPVQAVPAAPQAAAMQAARMQGGPSCTRAAGCPDACPLPPFCAGHLPIKGLCNPATGARRYLFPGQPGYHEATVGLYLEDRWFCSLNEAAAAGFLLGP